MCEKGFIHAVKGEGNGFQLYKGGNQRFPDFYSLENQVVLDAKYKRLNNGIQRNDLYQLITYIHTLNDGKVDGCVDGAKCGAFIYPYDGEDAKNKEIAWKKLFGMCRYIGVIPIVIPNSCKSIEDFCVNIEKNIANINFAECPSVENETSGKITLCEE